MRLMEHEHVYRSKMFSSLQEVGMLNGGCLVAVVVVVVVVVVVHVHVHAHVLALVVVVVVIAAVQSQTAGTCGGRCRSSPSSSWRPWTGAGSGRLVGWLVGRPVGWSVGQLVVVVVGGWWLLGVVGCWSLLVVVGVVVVVSKLSLNQT